MTTFLSYFFYLVFSLLKKYKEIQMKQNPGMTGLHQRHSLNVKEGLLKLVWEAANLKFFNQPVSGGTWAKGKNEQKQIQILPL